MNQNRWYIEVHSTMTDDVFYFVCDDEITAQLSEPLVRKLIHAPNEDEYMRTLTDLELNGVEMLDNPDDIDSEWEQYCYIEDRF